MGRCLLLFAFLGFVFSVIIMITGIISGTPEERAAEDIKDPVKMLRKYSGYFDSYKGVKIANICGSCGKKAIPLALLGAEVTVFDISEDNKRYAIEVAQAANTKIEYAGAGDCDEETLYAVMKTAKTVRIILTTRSFAGHTVL